MPPTSDRGSTDSFSIGGPFDRSSFIFPSEWQTLADLLGANDTGLLFIQDGIIIHANASLCQQLECAEDDLLGKPVASLLDHAGTTLGEPLRGELLHLRAKGGAALPFCLLENRVDTLSHASCTIWVLQPAGHRLAPEKYTADATQAMAILDYLPDLVCVCAPDGRLSYASRPLAELLERPDLAGTIDQVHSLLAFTHHDDRTRLSAMLEQLAAQPMGGACDAFTVRLRTGKGNGKSHGEWCYARLHGRNLVSHHAVGGLLLNGQDVSEEYRRQHELAVEKKRQLHYLNRLFRIAQRPHANLNSALTVILKSSARALCTHRCAYWQISEDPHQSACVMSYDDVRQAFIEPQRDALFETVLHPLLYRVLHGEHPLVVGDVAQDPRAALHYEYFHAESIKAAMIVPVQNGEGPIGLLTLFHQNEARSWRRDEAEFAENVARLICLIRREVERSHSEAQLRHMAHHDNLTGLPNRHFLFDQAEDIFPSLAASSNSLAAFFIDLDGFKGVNDALGHAVGDELLKAAALRLKNVVRKDDILVRLGGDEFMLLARDLSDMTIADDIAQQIVEIMRNPFSLHGRALQISASVGIAMYPRDGVDIDTLMKKADMAMYQAKSAGRDQYRMFSPRAVEIQSDKIGLESELRRAMEERELRHYFQPQIDLRTGHVRCVEALLRWHHPRHGVLMPASFLPAAEKSGLINTITAWVLDDVCQQMRTWEKAGMNGFNMAINLSSSQLMDAALLPALEQALDRTGIPASCLEWEITESTAMQHNTMATTLLERAAALDVHLSIDDFGTGYSNMAYLRQYPVHKVKIDDSFVSGLPDASDQRAITDAIISMARPLGLDVVAEGVETPEQMEYLRDHGCDIAQGFFFSQPLTVEQFEKWLIRH